ncbi:MAG: hypothetical protein V3T77_10870, partial [Planctomycetota bacterium]
MPNVPPEDQEPSLRDFLSRDELRELLSPLREVAGAGDPLLLLSERPEDVEFLKAYLQGRGVPLIFVGNRFTALDLFRMRRYLGVVATAEALGAEVVDFL